MEVNCTTSSQQWELTSFLRKGDSLFIVRLLQHCRYWISRWSRSLLSMEWSWHYREAKQSSPRPATISDGQTKMWAERFATISCIILEPTHSSDLFLGRTTSPYWTARMVSTDWTIRPSRPLLCPSYRVSMNFSRQTIANTCIYKCAACHRLRSTVLRINRMRVIFHSPSLKRKWRTSINWHQCFPGGHPAIDFVLSFIQCVVALSKMQKMCRMFR